MLAFALNYCSHVNILEVAGSITVDLNLAIWIIMEISTRHNLACATPTARVEWNHLKPGRTGLI